MIGIYGVCARRRFERSSRATREAWRVDFSLEEMLLMQCELCVAFFLLEFYILFNDKCVAYFFM